MAPPLGVNIIYQFWFGCELMVILQKYDMQVEMVQATLMLAQYFLEYLPLSKDFVDIFLQKKTQLRRGSFAGAASLHLVIIYKLVLGFFFS
jgi:hypothetical protein